jgi:hypothetical protein
VQSVSSFSIFSLFPSRCGKYFAGHFDFINALPDNVAKEKNMLWEFTQEVKQ